MRTVGDRTLLNIQDLYEQGKSRGRDESGTPTPLDLIVDEDSCPDRITLGASLMFLFSVWEQFRRDGCDEDMAIRMTEDFLLHAPTKSITSLWRSVGLSFVATIRENGGRYSTVKLIHEAKPLDEE